MKAICIHVCYSALQEAQDIFGVDFDFDEFEQYGEDYDEEEELEEEVLSCICHNVLIW